MKKKVSKKNAWFYLHQQHVRNDVERKAFAKYFAKILLAFIILAAAIIILPIVDQFWGNVFLRSNSIMFVALEAMLIAAAIIIGYVLVDDAELVAEMECAEMERKLKDERIRYQIREYLLHIGKEKDLALLERLANK